MAKTGVIYKLACQDVTAAEIYVGSTESVRNRKASHKYISERPEHKDYHLPVYTYINANGGWKNWELIELERMMFTNKAELRARERYWKEHLKATLNTQVPNRSKKEWFSDNKEYVKRYLQVYHSEHKEKAQKRYQEKRDEILADRATQVECECGSSVCKGSLIPHRKTHRHQANMLYNFIYS